MAVISTTRKRCCRCRRVKPISDFNRHRGTIDGRQYDCRDCHRRSHRSWLSRNPVTANKHRRKWDRENPEKRRAQHLVEQAIECGNLVRKPCEGCGATDNVHAHHADYDKPLEVQWLCPVCHRQLHAEQAVIQ